MIGVDIKNPVFIDDEDGVVKAVGYASLDQLKPILSVALPQREPPSEQRSRELPQREPPLE